MSTSSSSKRCRQFSLEEINAVTNQFKNKLLGKGGEAMVYFAEIYIGSKKTPVAVKYLKDTTKEFESEIQTLAKIQHPNIVSLIGYCNESGQKILVYEYMENGCLSDYLKKKKDKPLSWLQRLNICLDVARGLQHLHSETNEFPKGLIHRDVKPGNILVGENWVGKLSDFGILKLSNAGQVKSSMVTDRKGTSGYFAPEYHKFGRVTRKIDVYAFGVVLFQVLCEKMPWDREDESYYFDENEDLGIWAQKNFDAQIRREMSGDSFTLFTDIIGRSLQGNPGKRPTMEKVVLDLEKVLLECQESENQPKQLDDTEEIYLQPSPSKWPTIDDVVLNLQKVLSQRWADSWIKNIKAPPKVSSITPKYPCQEEEEDRHTDNDKLTLLEGEVKMVMGRLGLSCHLNGGKIYEQVGSNKMETLFDEIEPSLEEVKQAFDVFDANKDGFIDSMELKKVLCALGFVHSTDHGVCQSMISSYDDDGDGLVNFIEFVKLFEKSFY